MFVWLHTSLYLLDFRKVENQYAEDARWRGGPPQGEPDRNAPLWNSRRWSTCASTALIPVKFRWWNNLVEKITAHTHTIHKHTIHLRVLYIRVWNSFKRYHVVFFLLLLIWYIVYIRIPIVLKLYTCWLIRYNNFYSYLFYHHFHTKFIYLY